MINVIALINQQVLISTIEEVPSELGEPDCKLINTFKLIKTSESYTLEPWLDFSDQNEIMIHSDSILTIVDPKKDILSKYFELLA